MPNRNYVKGRNWEYYVMKQLRKLGYYTVRSYASKGVFDVIAVPPSSLSTVALLIQCKVRDYVPPAERSALVEAQKRYNGIVLIATKDKKGKLIFKAIQEYNTK